MPLTAARAGRARRFPAGASRFFLVALAGAAWGVLTLAVNALTGVFALEGSLGHDAATFAAGGALMGLVAGGLLALLGGVMPFRRVVARAVLVSTGLWLALRLVGALLSHIEPERFHVLTVETLQGLLMSAALGVLLSFVIGPAGRPAP